MNVMSHNEYFYTLAAKAFGVPRTEAKTRLIAAAYGVEHILQPVSETSKMREGVEAMGNLDMRYVSLDVPTGYDTVLGYLAKYDPDILELTPLDNAEETKRDGWKLAHWCYVEGIAQVKVTAPPILQEQGIEQVNAYPLHLLQRRFK